MKRILLPALFLLFSVQPGQAGPEAVSSPVSGVFDLREVQMDEGFLISLNGEWEFFWEQFVMPEEYAVQKGSGLLVGIPSYWSSYVLDGQQLPGMGYGTYALTILLPKNRPRVICMDIPVFDVAYRFYLNDRLIHQSGTLGTSREEEKPWYNPSSMCMEVSSDTLEILVQVSNFHHRRGGFWQEVVLGDSSKLLKKTERRKMYSYSTIGVLFFFILFFLLFWLISRKDLSMILFALTLMGMLIRSVNTGEFFSNYFIDTSWTWQIRMEYVGTYLAMAVGMLFLHNIMPRKYMKPILIANSLLMLLLIILVFALPPWLFTYTLLVFQPLILIFLVHYLIISFAGLLKGRLSEIIFFLSLSIFMYALVNDMLLANTGGSASSSYLSQLSFQVFILAMAILIIVNRVENEQVREQLEGSLRFKNRVLSVIAHDLKNPVASIAQFSELLATKPELSSKPDVIQSLHDSSQAAVTLLDNLLFWGRTQSNDLSIHPTHFEAGVLILDIKSLFGHMALQKKVELNITPAPHTKIYADKAQINIIIRNLLSNAIKFTPSGGKVDVETQEEGEMVRITVRDTGIGIEPNLLKQFKEDGRLGTSPGTDQELGTGLGLQLISELVSRNQGVLDIKSSPHKGSTFSFTLPSGNKNEDET